MAIRTLLAGALALVFMHSSAWAGKSPIRFLLEQGKQGATENGGKSGRFSLNRLKNGDLGAAGFRGPSVVAEAVRWLGHGNMTGTFGPWCADALSFWLRRTGHRPLAGRMASDALRYGPRLAAPRIGSLIVLPRHVGLVAGVEGDQVTMISGNWGRRVALARLSRRAAIAFVAIP